MSDPLSTSQQTTAGDCAVPHCHEKAVPLCAEHERRARERSPDGPYVSVAKVVEFCRGDGCPPSWESVADSIEQEFGNA